ncbi:MAG: hypothetical protein ABI560_18120 [Myxococcales bacterium]
MNERGARWIRVKTESDLRAGMTVELRPCGFCGRRERLILLGVEEKHLSLHHSGDMLPGQGKGWRAAPGLCLNPRRPVDLSVAISTGRLWRLADEFLNESTTTDVETVVSTRN